MSYISTKPVQQKVQHNLEQVIIAYQDACNKNQQINITKYYEEICRLYPPIKFINVWLKKYGHLFDTREDFTQDYLRVFCTSLLSWKPRSIRKESKYGGSGDFKNFFWSSLSNNYINMIKAESSAKRNQEKQCPICEQWVSPLSKHLIQKHSGLLYERIQQMGFSVSTLVTCPFCKSYKNPHYSECEHITSGCCDSCKMETSRQSLCKHFISMHSAYLFEHFHDLYPEHLTLPNKPSSIYHEDDNGETYDLYDRMPSNNHLDSLLSLSLTQVQQNIVDKILNGNNFKYSASVYKCNYDTYTKELEDLKNKMTLCGME